MKAKLNILLLEDDIADAKLIINQLEEIGGELSVTRVQTETEFREALQTNHPDVIISDHGLPSFSGFKALEVVLATDPALPFIFVSGSNDQGMVARMYEAGATDYVFKQDIGDLKGAVLEAVALLPPDAR